MKSVLMFLLFVFMGISSFSQNISTRIISSENNYSGLNLAAPKINVIMSPLGQKYVLSKIKAYGWDVHYEPNDTILKVSYFDSLLFNQQGLVETRYNAPTGNAMSKFQYSDSGWVKQIDYYTQDGAHLLSRISNEYNSYGDIVKTAYATYVYPYFSYTVESIYDNLRRLTEYRQSNGVGFSYTYDSYGNMVERASIAFINGKWEKDSRDKVLMTYDVKRNMLDSVMYEYNITTEGWHESGGTKRTRDSGGKVLSQVDFFVFNNNWDSVAYTYNTNGLLSSKFHSKRLQGAEGDVYDDVLEEYEYNSDNLILYTVSTEYFLDLMLKWRKSNIYEGSQLQESLSESWVSSLSKWLPYQKEVFNYSAEKYLLSYVNQEYVDSLSEWKDLEKILYKYDDNGNCTNVDVYYVINGNWKSFYSSYITIPGANLTLSAQRIELGYTLVNTMGVDDNIETAPAKFSLTQNYPNPFNPETKISFTLPQSGKASLKVYDMLGREVIELVNGDMSAGAHEITFSGRNLSSGVYIYRLQSGSYTASKKMILMK